MTPGQSSVGEGLVVSPPASAPGAGRQGTSPRPTGTRLSQRRNPGGRGGIARRGAARACALALLINGCAAPPGPAPAGSGGEMQTTGQPKRIVAAVQSNPPTISSQQVPSGSATLQR